MHSPCVNHSEFYGKYDVFARKTFVCTTIARFYSQPAAEALIAELNKVDKMFEFTNLRIVLEEKRIRLLKGNFSYIIQDLWAASKDLV